MPGKHDPNHKFEHLRKQAEELIQQHPALSSETPSDILELIHELKIHQIELEIQNEELKQAQHGLSDLYREYENLYEFAPCGYLTLNAKGIITNVNLTGVNLLGNTKQLLLHSGLSQFIDLGHEGAYLAARKKSGETGEKQRLELPLKGESELPIWIQVNIEADRDETGAVIQWRVIFMDITQKKVLESALQESEEKYRSIMEAMQDGVYICSPEFRIEYLNPAMINRLNHDATGEICHHAIWGNDEKCSYCAFDEIRKGKHFDIEFADLKNNSYISSSSPIHHLDGSISKLTILRDITRMKKIENRFRQIQKMDAIGVLAGGIAHQFNNILNTITGSIDLIEWDSAANKNVAHYANVMKSSVNQMTLLTSQLLAFARGGKYEVEKVNLSDFVRDTVSLVEHAIDSVIEVDIDLARESLYAEIDEVQLQMSMSAILSNASESMEGKRGHILVTCQKFVMTDDHTKDFSGLNPGIFGCISISDDGKGMDEETRNRIFEPFFTTNFQGRGLGMAATYGIVKNHGGWISVDSESGKGSRVNIYLPTIESPVREDPEKIQKTKPVNPKGSCSK